MSGPGHNWDGIGEQVDAAAQEIAKAALGINPKAQMKALDTSTLELFVAIGRDGYATVNASIPKRAAAARLRQIADMWDQEWKAEEHAKQKARRKGAES